MAPGASSMLRSRRKDANVKPNRRLDKKSSRGMLYENEELRMRTININEEVERGQSDIKKLRRENEQLRREIWGLRDEYDRLEGIIEDLKDETDSEDESDYDEEEEEEPEVGENVENPENLENAQKEQKATNAHAPPPDMTRGSSFKKDFDGLSVVDEETDDNPSTSANDVTHDPTLPSGSRIGWNYDNAAYQAAAILPSPSSWQHDDTPRQPPCLEGKFFARMPSQMNEPRALLPDNQFPLYGNATLPNPFPYDMGVLNSENAFCGTITLPSGRQGVYYSDSTLPNGGPEGNAIFLDGDYAGLPHWGGKEMLPSGPHAVLSDSETDETGAQRAPKISFSYSYYGDDGSTGLTNLGPSSIQTAAIQTVYDRTSPLPSDYELLSDCFDKRCGPDLVMSSVYPVDKSMQPVFQNGGNLDQFLEEVNGNMARVEIVTELPDGGGTDQGDRHALAPVHEYGGSVRAAQRWQNSQLLAAANSSSPISPVTESPESPARGGSVRAGAPQWSNSQPPPQNEQYGNVQATYVRTPESRKVLQVYKTDDQQLIPRQESILSNVDSSSGGGSILKHRQSIVSTTISVSRRDEEVETYREPPPYIRLNSIRPNTLVFASAYADLTVQEVIDELDSQVPSTLSDSVRGVRVVNGNCFICFAKPDDVGTLLNSGFTLRGSPVHLEDVSRGSVIVSLTGVPHHVTDLAVAVIMSNFGTIIGEVERRLYKGVDTGERLLRIKPGTQPMPPTILVAGAQVRITLLPAQDVARLGFVGTRDVPAPETTNNYDNNNPRNTQDQSSKYNPGSVSGSLDNSYNDRYKSQLMVHLKTPDSPGNAPSHDPDMPKTFVPFPNGEKKISNAKSPNVATNQPIFSKVGNGGSPAARKYSSVRTPQNNTQPPIANSKHIYLPDGSIPSNPFTNNLQTTSPNNMQLYPEQHGQTHHQNMPAQNNPFIPGFTQISNDHVNPTFNTYTPRNSPTMDRKFSGTNTNTFADGQSNLPNSPLLARKPLATYNSVSPQTGPSPSSNAPLQNSQSQVPTSAIPCVPNSSYLHGKVPSSLQSPQPSSSEPNTSNQNIEQNQSNALKSSQTQSPENRLEIPVPPASSVPNSPLSGRKQKPIRKISTMSRQRSSDEIAHNQLSASAPVSRHQTAPNSPNLHRKNTRGGRKLSNHSTSSQNIDNSENERSLPNATSSPLPKPKHGNRKLSVSINEPQVHAGTNPIDVSRSSSSGQDSPTKGDRRRRVSIYFNNKKTSRRNSATVPNTLTRSASLDTTRCRFVNPALDGTNAEQTTTCSERERTNSVSSRGSSVGGGARRKSRRSSFKALDGAESGKVPWCGCWGNGCV